MRRNVIPTSPLSAQQLRSEQRGSYWTPRPAGNPLTVFLLPCLPNLLPPSWLKGRELHNTRSCAFSSRASLHSGTPGSNGGALALYTEECPGALPYICAVAQPSHAQCTISWFAGRGWVLLLKEHSDVP